VRIGELAASVELKIRSCSNPILTIALVAVAFEVVLEGGISKAINHHRHAIARVELSELRKGLTRYYFDNGYYPTTDEGLGALIPSLKMPLDDKDPGILRPAPWYSRPLLDPWGRPFIYESEGDSSYVLKSLGADGTGNDPGLTTSNSPLQKGEGLGVR
jgi:Type II secretion system (T2SS), protein G